MVLMRRVVLLDFGRGNGVYGQGNGHPAPTNAGIFSPATGPASKKKANGGTEGGKDLHMFVWSSSASPVSEGGIHVFRGGGDYGNEIGVGAHPKDYDEFGREEFTFGNKQNGNDREGLGQWPSSTTELRPKIAQEETKATAMPPASVMTRLILIMVWRKLIRTRILTPVSLDSIFWSLVSFKWNVQMPAIIAKSISILSDAGLGMAMFSLGMFVVCSWHCHLESLPVGKQLPSSLMGVRLSLVLQSWLLPPLQSDFEVSFLHIAIVQAALPQGIVPSVFAKEYGVHPDILSTGVIFDDVSSSSYHFGLLHFAGALKLMIKPRLNNSSFL
ncbi:hypothetical protein HAX54_043545 [Datura stramonium]|uniref:PIN-like protein n=1 Tax=Datura stramonium TaxID=4076 RepID=A0ABS8W3V1_DATST|nr:hypothetical protein [Datura stramonium]